MAPLRGYNLYYVVLRKTVPDVVGGTHRLGCWQRHSPRRAKHVQIWKRQEPLPATKKSQNSQCFARDRICCCLLPKQYEIYAQVGESVYSTMLYNL